MVGRKVEILNRDITDEKENENQEVCLELEHFRVSMPGEVARDISLQIKKGEIFGIGGLAGHGKSVSQTESWVCTHPEVPLKSEEKRLT